MKRAAITGIAGQDGTYLARWLLHQGYEVHGLLRLPFDREEARLRRRFPPTDLNAIRWHTGSLNDPFALLRFLKAALPTELYHLAGVSDSRQSFVVPEETIASITLGTLRLLEAAREACPAARIFLASSAEIFGAPSETPQRESTLRQPSTPYGIAKVAADQLGRLHRETYQQFVVSGILYNHESPLRHPNYLSRRVAEAVAGIKAGQRQELELADLSAERDWSDARDLVRGYQLALQAQTPGDYVFASGQPHRVADLVDCAFRAAGLDYRKFVRVTNRTLNSQQVVKGLQGDPTKAATELGWQRRWTFARTIEDMVRAELEARPELERADPLWQ
ncbi:MAG: GDP-mannose 4,6-dehydratase [Verrucomicrobiae bacterium]|nr:GDP-mannose 4,6-dehydratase [Verrucomicrobiae bacterium]